MRDTLDSPTEEACDLHSSSAEYGRRFSGALGRWMLDVQLSGVRRLLAVCTATTILDVGGGHAQVAPPLSEDGHEVTVIASSQEALGRIAELEGPLLHAVLGSLGELPFASGSFDVVIALRMMPHVPNWPAFLGGLCRVARHGVVVDFPTRGGFNALQPVLFGLKRRLERNTRRFTTMSLREVAEVLDRHGFEPKEEIRQFVLPMVLHRVLGCQRLSSRLEAALRALKLSRFFGGPVLLLAVPRRALAGDRPAAPTHGG
jgi:SAM-dependent methyltransferase